MAAQQHGFDAGFGVRAQRFPCNFASRTALPREGPLNALDQALRLAGLNQAERGAVLGLSQSAVSRLGKHGQTFGAKDTNAYG
jgi:hypothetical protein